MLETGLDQDRDLILECICESVINLLEDKWEISLTKSLNSSNNNYYNINKTLQTNVLSSMIEHCSVTSSSSFYFSENNLLIMDNDSGLFARWREKYETFLILKLSPRSML